MRFSVRGLVFMAMCVLLLTGCQHGSPFLAGQQPQNAPGGLADPNAALNANNLLAQANQQSQSFATQIQEAQRKLTQADGVNRELTARIAQAEQLLNSEREQKKLIQQQLAQAADQLKTTLSSRDELERRANALYASQRQIGGASITANNSIRSSLRVADIAGLEVRQEGTTVRVEIPADRLFAPATMQLLPQSAALLDDVAAAIAKNYPRQLLVVEGHTDNSAAVNASPAASHQLTAAQAHAVVDYWLSRGRLPANQVSSMAFGAHRPRVSNATPQGQAKNRRLEIVIYPETVDGKP